jgi:hypothetical protein
VDSSFEHLSVFAEVAAARVGFVAIFLVVVQQEEKFPAEDAIRIRVMILVGFAGICLSLLPIAIAETKLDHVQVWIVSSAAFIVMVGSIAVYTAVRHFQLPDAARENIPWSNLLIGWSCVAVAGGASNFERLANACVRLFFFIYCFTNFLACCRRYKLLHDCNSKTVGAMRAIFAESRSRLAFDERQRRRPPNKSLEPEA